MGDQTGRLPDFVICGEAKCGTTTLWQMLSRHPQVYFPEEKELHFFSSYADHSGIGRYESGGLEHYRALFSGARPEQRCGEATPNYLFDEGACRRMGSVLPAARLVFILRDPIERAWSHYWHQVRRGNERLGFEDALEQEAARMATGDADARQRFSYASRGRYIDGLRRYEQTFSRQALCVVFLEDMRHDAQGVLRQVCAHLGVASDGAAGLTSLPHANKASFPRWPVLDQLTRGLRRWAEARGPAVAGLAKRIGLATRPLRVYSGMPRLREQTRAELRRHFADSDRELGAWLGRTVPWLE